MSDATQQGFGLSHPGLAPAVSDPNEAERETMDYGDVTLGRIDANRLATFLAEELARADSDTTEYRQKCRDALDFVDPVVASKSFPWTNAANFFIPIPRTVVDAFKSSFKQTVFKQKEMFVAEVISTEYAGIAEGQEHDTQRAFAKAAEEMARSVLRLKSACDKWLDEILICGIGPLKLVRDTSTKTLTCLPTTGGEVPVEREVVLHNGPRLYAVPVGTWCWPAGLWNSVQEMPWVGNWVELTGATLRQRAQAPFNYVNVEKVIAGGSELALGNLELGARLSKIGQMPSEGNYIIHEVYLDWDLKDDGKLHSIVVTFNLATTRILRIKYTDSFKPYFVEVASPRSGTVFGRGIIEPIMQPCKAINMAVNQTFDSQTLANTPSLLYPEDSTIATTLAASGGFFPGIPLPYKEAKDEVGILEFPSPSDTSFKMIGFFQQIVERLTRIGPSRLGEVSEGRRTPATLGLSTQQLGAELLDELIDRSRDTVGQVIDRAFVLQWQEDPGWFERVLGMEKGSIVRSVIEKSVREGRTLGEAIRVRLTASSSVRSVELERQNALSTAQLTMGWYAQVIQLVQMFATVPDPTVRNILLTILKSSEEQMRRLVELANQPDARVIIPDLAEQLAGLPAPPMVPPASPEAGGAPAAEGGGAPGAQGEVPPNPAMQTMLMNMIASGAMGRGGVQ